MQVRQYVKGGDKIYPTKLGVHLTGSQFTSLLHHLEEINIDLEAVRAKKDESFNYDLGEGLRVTASQDFPLVHIRLFFQNEFMPFALPTKAGIALKFDEWGKLVELIDQVKRGLESV